MILLNWFWKIRQIIIDILLMNVDGFSKDVDFLRYWRYDNSENWERVWLPRNEIDGKYYSLRVTRSWRIGKSPAYCWVVYDYNWNGTLDSIITSGCSSSLLSAITMSELAYRVHTGGKT